MEENISAAYDMAALEEEYRRWAVDCSCGMRLVLAKIENAREQMSLKPDRNPFAYIESRIKTFESTFKKCKRKYCEEGQAPTMEIIKANVHDIAGIRITTDFQDDVYSVRDEIIHQPGILVVEEKDYIKNEKPNGYRSLHLNVQNEIYSSFEGISKLVPVEIQIRDRAQDLWAAIEHITNYKNEDRPPQAGELFKQAAMSLDNFGKFAMEIRDYKKVQNRKAPAKKGSKK